MLGHPLKGKGKTVEEQEVDHEKRKARVSFPVYVDQKIDGYRCVAFVEPEGEVYGMSRGGKLLNLTPAIEQALRDIAEAIIHETESYAEQVTIVFDGELYCRDYQTTKKIAKRSDLNEVPDLVPDIRYFVFDSMTKERWDEKRCPYGYATRLYILERAGVPISNEHVPSSPVVRPEVTVAGDWEAVDRAARRHLPNGWEGSMVKAPDGRYEWKRSWNILKLKPNERDDFEIEEITESSKMPGHAEHFVVRMPNGETCDASSGGLTHAERKAAWENRAALIGSIVEVEFKEFTKAGVAREPVVKLIREDR
jgi:ATP-dependent DNA ligase